MCRLHSYAALTLMFGLAVPVLAAPGPLTLTDSYIVPNAVILNYNVVNGQVDLKGYGLAMTSFQLESASGSFVIENISPGFAVGPSDIVTKNKLFTSRTEPFTELFIGRVLPAGATRDYLAFDLTIDGTLDPSGFFSDAAGGGPYLTDAPEPSAFTLILAGALLIMPRRRHS